MCIPGILAYKSIVNGNCSIDVPNLRNKEERDAYRNDTFCTYAESAGDQLVSNNIHTEEGGKHEEGFKNSLMKIINEYAIENKLMKNNYTSYLVQEVRIKLLEDEVKELKSKIEELERKIK